MAVSAQVFVVLRKQVVETFLFSLIMAVMIQILRLGFSRPH